MGLSDVSHAVKDPVALGWFWRGDAVTEVRAASQTNHEDVRVMIATVVLRSKILLTTTSDVTLSVQLPQQRRLVSLDVSAISSV